MWNEKNIRYSNYIKSIFSFSIPICIGLNYGSEYTALWFFFRTLSQLVFSYIPNPIYSLIYIKDLHNFNISAVVRKGYLYVVIPFFILYVASELFKPYISSRYTDYLDFNILLYTFLFSLGNYSNLIARAVRRSDLLLKSAKIEFLLVLFLLFSLLWGLSWEFFIYIASLKEMLKIVYIVLQTKDYHRGESFFGKRLVKSRFIKVSVLKHLLRLPVKTLYQSGDRLVFPLLFPLTLSGNIAYGSSFAMFFAIMSSSLVTWATPLLRNGGVERNLLVKKWFNLITWIIVSAFALVISLLIVRYYLIDIPILDNINEFFIVGFVFSSVSSINTILTVLTKERLTQNRWVFIPYVQLFLVYSFVFVSYDVFEFSIVISISSGILVQLLSFLVLSSKQRDNK